MALANALGIVFVTRPRSRENEPNCCYSTLRAGRASTARATNTRNLATLQRVHFNANNASKGTRGTKYCWGSPVSEMPGVCVSGNAYPTTAQSCEDAASAAGLTLGGGEYPFLLNITDIPISGCFFYPPSDEPTNRVASVAFFVANGTDADKQIRLHGPLQFRIPCPVSCIAYQFPTTVAARRAAALNLDFILANSNFASSACGPTKGSYYYTSGKLANTVQFGKGGTDTQMRAGVDHLPQSRLSCTAVPIEGALTFVLTSPGRDCHSDSQ